MITKAIKAALAELEQAVKDVHAHCDAAGEHFNDQAHEVAHELVIKLWDVANEVDDKLHELLAKHHPEAIAQEATDAQARVAAEIAEQGAAVTTKNPDAPPAPGTEAAFLAGDPRIPGVDDEPNPGTAMAPGSGVAAINEPIIPAATEGTLEIKGADAVEAVKELANEPINEALAAGAVAGAVPTPGADESKDPPAHLADSITG